MIQKDRYIARILVESTPPGSTVYINKRVVGKTPLVVRQPYSHIKERVVFGGQRTGTALLGTGGAGTAVGVGLMAVGGAYIGETESSVPVSLISLGMLGAVYGIVGMIYGTVAIVGSPAPRQVLRSVPYTLRVGLRGADGTFNEVIIANLDRDQPLVNFGEMTRVRFDHNTGKWSSPGLQTLNLSKAK